MTARLYEQQNPWITFRTTVEFDALWAKLGEAFSKTQHLAGTPLPPQVAMELGRIFLRKGALATTAIEGNTLSEEEAEAILDKGKKMPASQEYLEQELQNVVEALEAIDASGRNGNHFSLTPEWIRDQNRIILNGLDVEEHVAPGEYSVTRLTVGRYRAAPTEDTEFLIDRMCAWLDENFVQPSQDEDKPLDQRFYHAFLGAVLGHLYLVWIHPFGDGNGRTARLLEVALLAHCGVVPWVSSNLLSDHYNKTRSRYYQRLEAASERNEVAAFIEYSAGGYVDMLRDQISMVQAIQRRTAWVNYVHEAMRDEPSSPTKERRRDMVLALPEEPTPRSRIRRLNAAIAEQYAGHEDRMVARDLGALEKLGLIQHVSGRGARATYRPRIEIMDAFLPM